VTAAERLQAAIEKLEALKAESTGPNAWVADGRYRIAHADPSDGLGRMIVAAGSAADVRLIVTLVRTIDAQLDVLRLASAFYGAGITGPDSSTAFAECAVALADAILGEA